MKFRDNLKLRTEIFLLSKLEAAKEAERGDNSFNTESLKAEVVRLWSRKKRIQI